MITNILAKIFGTRNDREIKKLQPIVDKINSLEPKIQALSDPELQNQTNVLREKLSQGKTLDDILPEAFATMREAARRVLGQRHYDVQLMGGIVMHQGKIAEMKTGEGKTLTATLPLYLNALSGKSSMLVTVNDYLVRRDAEWMGQAFRFLGLSVGCLQNSMNDTERKRAYNSDILYATNNELGFDYLRDNMKFRLEDYVQRELTYAIVDEVDSILIDEARTPLIISGSADESSSLYIKARDAVAPLIKDVDYEIDEKQRSVLLTESGNDKVEAFFNIPNMYAVESINILHHVSQALKAKTLFHRDVEYVVRDGEVLIVDEFTGRILQGRRYSDGLHQSIEAKEGVKIERESQTLASITLQNFFRLFTKLAGMTGTAMTESEEFYNTYKLDVVAIPTNQPMIRDDKDDLIFLTENGKFNAIVADVKERYAKKQPVLIGTVAIETSERLSHRLTAEGIVHEVLNAKQHAREAEIVEHAGKPGRITIATNMAGRGTDIKITAESREAGGLYILGTERHESRRIDNQLRGRAGRQGDPGESRFYISLEDNLIRVFAGGNSMRDRMASWGMDETESIESSLVSKVIESSQEKVEKHNFERRKHVLEYDDVMNQHRKVIYKYRVNVLEGAQQMDNVVQDMIENGIHHAVAGLQNENVSNSQKEVSPREGFIAFLTHMTGLPREIFTPVLNKPLPQLASFTTELVAEQYALMRQGKHDEKVVNAEKWIMLETIDQAWKQHMLNLDRLQEGISLRSWGQKNPLIEYKKEAFAMFADMINSIHWETIYRLFHLDISQFDTSALERKKEHELDALNMIGTGDNEDSGSQTVKYDDPQVGRNDVCPCGSGKKYKKCCDK